MNRLLLFALIVAIAFSTAVPVAAYEDIEVEIEPLRGPVGTRVQVMITGLTSEGQVAVFFANKDNIVATAEPDDYGFCMTSFIVGTYPAGIYGIWIKFNSTEYSSHFRLEPAAELNKPSASVGDNVVVNGKGFAAGKEVTVYFDDVKVTSGETKTDQNGTFTNLSFTIPEAGNGEHGVKVKDGDGNKATTPILIKQAAKVAPSSGPPGSSLNISGTGFESNSSIVIYFDGEDIGGTLSDDNGSFSINLLVPQRRCGIHKVKVTDGTNSYYLDFTITAGIILTPTTGNVGTHLNVEGTGFKESLPVTITYDGNTVLTTNADLGGGFSATFKVPPSSGGEHLIKATDGATTASATFTIELVPPPIPTPILPRDGATISQGLYFDWEGVSDPSGVSYNLVVASDPDFSNVVLAKEGLADSEYCLSDEEKLPPSKAAYYWRVKAIDGAFNTSEWSTPHMFYISSVSTIPEWAKYSLMALALVLLCFVCFWAGSMRAV